MDTKSNKPIFALRYWHRKNGSRTPWSYWLKSTFIQETLNFESGTCNFPPTSLDLIFINCLLINGILRVSLVVNNEWTGITLNNDLWTKFWPTKCWSSDNSLIACATFWIQTGKRWGSVPHSHLAKGLALLHIGLAYFWYINLVYWALLTRAVFCQMISIMKGFFFIRKWYNRVYSCQIRLLSGKMNNRFSSRHNDRFRPWTGNTKNKMMQILITYLFCWQW